MKIQSIKFIIAIMAICILFSCKNEQSASNDKITKEVEKKMKSNEVKSEAPFQVKSGIIVYDYKKLDGTITASHTFYFDDYGNTLKLEETSDQETTVYLFDQEKRIGLTIFPGRKPSKIRMRQSELNSLVVKHATSAYTKQPDEDIAGKKCTVYANNAKSAEGESKHIYWKYKGILLKEINRLGTGYILEATTFEEKALDSSVFSELKEIK